MFSASVPSVLCGASLSSPSGQVSAEDRKRVTALSSLPTHIRQSLSMRSVKMPGSAPSSLRQAPGAAGGGGNGGYLPNQLLATKPSYEALNVSGQSTDGGVGVGVGYGEGATAALQAHSEAKSQGPGAVVDHADGGAHTAPTPTPAPVPVPTPTQQQPVKDEAAGAGAADTASDGSHMGVGAGRIGAPLAVVRLPPISNALKEE